MTDSENEDSSPLRLLVKSYSNGLLNREQYLQVRSQLLKKLSTRGKATHGDLSNFLKIHQDTESLSSNRSYTASDWIIIVLGLLAAITLAYILYA
jgi:hypothetical protein